MYTQISNGVFDDFVGVFPVSFAHCHKFTIFIKSFTNVMVLPISRTHRNVYGKNNKTQHERLSHAENSDTNNISFMRIQ